MKFITLLFGILTIFSLAKADEECVYNGITYPKGKSDVVGKCESIVCTSGDKYKIAYCPEGIVNCEEGQHYYKTEFDYSKNQPECCPKYGCRE